MADLALDPLKEPEILKGPHNFHKWMRTLKPYALTQDVWGIITGTEQFLSEPKLDLVGGKIKILHHHVPGNVQNGPFHEDVEASHVFEQPNPNDSHNHSQATGQTAVPLMDLPEIPGSNETLQLFNVSWNMWREQRRRVALAQAMLLATTDEKYHSLVEDFEEPSKAFEALYIIFQAQAHPALDAAREKMEKLILEDGGDVMSFLHQLEALRSEIKDAGSSYSDQWMRLKILRSLPAEYGDFVDAYMRFEGHKPFDADTMWHLKMRLLNVESQIWHSKISQPAEQDRVNVAAGQSDDRYRTLSGDVRKSAGYTDKWGGTYKCQWCGKLGHSEKYCWVKCSKKPHNANKPSTSSHKKGKGKAEEAFQLQ